jgi:hypothetical protein
LRQAWVSFCKVESSQLEPDKKTTTLGGNGKKENLIKNKLKKLHQTIKSCPELES